MANDGQKVINSKETSKNNTIQSVKSIQLGLKGRIQ